MSKIHLYGLIYNDVFDHTVNAFLLDHWVPEDIFSEEEIESLKEPPAPWATQNIFVPDEKRAPEIAERLFREGILPFSFSTDIWLSLSDDSLGIWGKYVQKVHNNRKKMSGFFSTIWAKPIYSVSFDWGFRDIEQISSLVTVEEEDGHSVYRLKPYLTLDDIRKAGFEPGELGDLRPHITQFQVQHRLLSFKEACPRYWELAHDEVLLQADLIYKEKPWREMAEKRTKRWSKKLVIGAELPVPSTKYTVVLRTFEDLKTLTGLPTFCGR
jgi:hypothetical protein